MWGAQTGNIIRGTTLGRGLLAWRSKFGSHVDDFSYPKLTVLVSDRNSDDVSDYDCLEYARIDQRHPFAMARGQNDSEFLGAVRLLDNKAVSPGRQVYKSCPETVYMHVYGKGLSVTDR